MTEVVIRYRDMVLRLASRNCNSREDAEDVTQDVFFALLNRGIDFTDEAHLKAWLIRATIDRSKNTHRYIKRHPQTTYDPNIHDSEDKTTNHKESNMAIDCLKEEIAKQSELKDYFSISAMGIEGLFMEWIVRALKPGGKAFIVVQDGIMNRSNDKKLRNFILDEVCDSAGIQRTC